MEVRVGLARQPRATEANPCWDFQLKLEDEIGKHHFEIARDFHQRQRGLRATIQQLVANQDLVITPQLIDSTLKALGYNEP